MADIELIIIFITVVVCVIFMLIAFAVKCVKEPNNGSGGAGGKGGNGGKTGESPVEQSYSRDVKIMCPFCYSKFDINDVRFRFRIDNAVVYISANPKNEETVNFLRNRNLRATVKREDGLPALMELSKIDNGEVVARSPLRVCANEECNSTLSTAVGKYSPDSGLFLIGLKSSGKTVYITSVIDKLNKVVPGSFGCAFSPYNSEVGTKYIEEYYTKMFTEHLTPDATIKADQLIYEVHNPKTNKVVGITFSDIKGEISTDASEIYAGEDSAIAKTIEHSNYYLVTLDIMDMDNNDKHRLLNEAIFGDVFKNATADPTRKKKQYLAVVITKSDELVNYDKGRKGAEIFLPNSPIYSPVMYDNEYFDSQRKLINEGLKKYMLEKYPQLFHLTELAFFEENINYFAVSALGKPPVEGRCQQIAPIRVEEPVLWLLKKSGVFNMKGEN